MKKAALCTALSLLLISAVSLAQKTISEGTLVYDISLQSDGQPAAGNPLNGATSTVYLTGFSSRIDMSSNLGNEKTIYDAKTGTAVILKEYSGQKLMITFTKENWLEKNKNAEGLVFTAADGKKELLGYQCSKATAKLNDGSTITVFYTKDLIAQNKEYDPLFKSLGGLPLQYEVQTGKLKFIYTINKIDFAALSQAKFDIPKTGYRVITYAESKQVGKN